MRWYKKAAIDGDPYAQGYLGWSYLTGSGIGRDDFLAVYWFRKAAEQNDATGQYWLGECYQNGIGVKKDEALALSYYRQSAYQGVDLAQVALARDALEKEDYAAMVDWLRKAVDQGNADAEFLLGLCYEHGQGVPQSTWEAKKHYESAGEHGNSMGYLQLGALYANENSPIRNLPSAFGWYMKAAQDNNAQAQVTVAYMYMSGQGVMQNLSEGLKWLERACGNEDLADLGVLAPLSNLYAIAGVFYYEGYDNISQDYGKAFNYLSKAYESKELEEELRLPVIQCLVDCHQYGRGTARNPRKAAELRKLLPSGSASSNHQSQGQPFRKSQQKTKKEASKKTLPAWEKQREAKVKRRFFPLKNSLKPSQDNHTHQPLNSKEERLTTQPTT